MSPAPAVSVIIPTHNRARLLCRAVESVLRQTFGELECILVDDASTDETPEAIRRLESADSRVRSLRNKETRYGPASRNAGVRATKGELIAFLDDDDEWLPAKLEKQVALFQSLPADYGCVYCWADWVNARTGRVTRRHRPVLRGDVYAQTMIRNAIGCTPSLLIRRGAFEATGGWNESLRIRQDDCFVVRLCRLCQVDFVPESLVRVYYNHGNPQVSIGTSGQRPRDEIVAIKARYELFESRRWKYRSQAGELEAILGELTGLERRPWESVRHFTSAIVLAPFRLQPYRAILHLFWSLLACRLPTRQGGRS